MPRAAHTGTAPLPHHKPDTRAAGKLIAMVTGSPRCGDAGPAPAGRDRVRLGPGQGLAPRGSLCQLGRLPGCSQSEGSSGGRDDVAGDGEGAAVVPGRRPGCPREADFKVRARSPRLSPAPLLGLAGSITSPLRRKLRGRDGVGHRHPDTSAAGLEAEAFLIPSFCNQIAVLLLRLIPNLAAATPVPSAGSRSPVPPCEAGDGREGRLVPCGAGGQPDTKKGPAGTWCWRWDAAVVTHQEPRSCKGQTGHDCGTAASRPRTA